MTHNKNPVKMVGNACVGWDGQGSMPPLAQLRENRKTIRSQIPKEN